MPFTKTILALVLICGAGLTVCGQRRADKLPAQFLVVLGIAQDAGYPQIGCAEENCLMAQKDPRGRRNVVALGLVDRAARQKWLIEATPDITAQLFTLNSYLPSPAMRLDGVFVTHAHIGHYTGLMYFGREALGARDVPVYAMPRLAQMLTANAPWSQLVSLHNIALQPLQADVPVTLNAALAVSPFLVPHRDEFSETVGFTIAGPHKRALFIPDIDKWHKWRRDLREVIKGVDYALIDGTFYQNGELPNRDMAEIPHPFVSETLALLRALPPAEKAKVIFIHFNHTNPLIRPTSAARRAVAQQGFRVADEGLILAL